MGLARIVENKGSGLYTATPIYDLTRLNKLLDGLKQQQQEYLAVVWRALQTRDALESDASVAARAMHAVIDQWQQNMIAKEAAMAPLEPPTPTDPETSLPWSHPDRGQEPPLLAAINVARSAAGGAEVSRVDKLNLAALYHLADQGYTHKTGHFGSDGSQPFGRVLQQGYFASKVLELLSYGTTTPDAVLGDWAQDPDHTWLLDAEVIECGVAYHYAREHPAAHLWCVLLCVPGDPPTYLQFPDDPNKQQDAAQDAAEQQERDLEKIKPPYLDSLQPSQLAAVVEQFATAQQKLAAAQREIDRLMAEKLERDRRIAELETLKTRLENRVIEVWACYYTTGLEVGKIVPTAEPPAFWLDTPTVQAVTVDAGTTAERTVFFEERSWNIIREPKPGASVLAPVTPLSAELTFYNVAMEPGQLRWKPAWRYGFIITISGGVCAVVLIPALARGETEQQLDLNPDPPTLTNVPFEYPPCGVAAFTVGDEVLIAFEALDWTKPRVIGFRRAPRDCRRRISWEQIQ